MEEDLSDLLDTHQDRPTEVKTSRPGQDHHHSLDRNTDTADSTRDSRGGRHRGHVVISKGGDSAALLKSLERGRLL
ncbi:Nucleic acid-binding OB-fold [Penicillium chrysogenum]|uniref:Nucleic acid-binding OB-fold n=1 Tax=Penicillium chrysogenum TaxID=5076 RepID=A0ABQ8WRY3_PENCH|nr:Nucleic acid-binding OB-fold [Penicillium chrysogenum]KAJ6156832.1 Nucleic acid-binding OB-fold [Penicillium chrysogenum]